MRHHLQKSILDRLATADHLRYADINADKLDGNVFTYHLKQLLADKLVRQNDDKSYSLTQSGRSYIVHRYENTVEAAHSIFLVIIRHQDKLLLRRRLVQPMLGYSGFIHGEPLFAQSVDAAVSKRVKEKTGLETTMIRVVGSGLIRMTVGGEMNNFSHALLIEASVTSPDLMIERDNTGENFWVEQATLTSVTQLIPSCLDLLAYAENPNGVFDLQYDLYPSRSSTSISSIAYAGTCIR